MYGTQAIACPALEGWIIPAFLKRNFLFALFLWPNWCLLPARLAFTLPLAVILKRFAAAFFVFNFGMTLSLYLCNGARTTVSLLPSNFGGASTTPQSFTISINRSKSFLPCST